MRIRAARDLRRLRFAALATTAEFYISRSHCAMARGSNRTEVHDPKRRYLDSATLVALFLQLIRLNEVLQ